MFRYNNDITHKSITLNDVPIGTVFEGTITLPSGNTYRGVWLRMHNTGERPVFAVCLTAGAKSDPTYPVVAYRCLEVRGYRELNNPQIVEG